MKCVCKGAKIYFELDMRHRSLAVEAVPMGKALAGQLTHSRIELPPSVRLVIGLFQGRSYPSPPPRPPSSLPLLSPFPPHPLPPVSCSLPTHPPPPILLHTPPPPNP